MSNSAATLTTGDLVGNYRILGLLGAGGMGVVYRALDVKLERTVALKFLPEHQTTNQDDRKRVLREARTASQLDHPNIGVIHGFEETDDGRVFIVMAYYEGETLARKIAHGPLPVPEAVDIAIQICDGLAAAHASAIVHRDVKPSNVIITPRGVAKIVDFGLARLSTGASTQSISSGGTVGYMSPEQAMGKMVDQHTDVWSLAVTLAEMITGRNPFVRDSAAATVIGIVSDPPQPMDEIPVDLLRIIYRALAKEPELRYQNCGEMLPELKDFRREVEVAVTAPPSTRRSTLTAKELRPLLEHASRSSLGNALTVQHRRQRWLVVLAIIAIVIAGLSFVPPVREKVTQSFTHSEEHIAVLPFDNIGGDASTDAVAQGLMDSMTNALSNLGTVQKSLWVIPASVVRGQKITDPMMANRELGATLVVKGSIQRKDQTVHLSVNLIDAKNLRQIGSASLEDSSGDLAALQNEAVSRLARLMNIKVSADFLKTTGGSVAPAAYESYLKALGLMQRYDKPGNLDQAITALKSAVETDPRFALGYAQLGEAFRLKYNLDVNPKWIEQAKTYSQKAVELDDHVPAVYVTLGRIHEAAGEHDLAVQEFQRALALDARSANALNGLAHSQESAGHVAEAEATFKKAAALRPDYWDVYNEMGLFYDRQSKYKEAIEQLKRAVQLTPDNSQVYSNLAAVYIDSADPKLRGDAEQALKKSIDLSPTYFAYANLGSLYFDEKRYAEAASVLEKALQINGDNYLVWIWLMNSYDWLGEQDKSAAAADKAFGLLSKEAQAKPRDASAQVILADLSARKKLTDKAMGHLQTALALAPDDPDILADAASAYELMGNRAKALAAAHKALDKGFSLDKLKNDHVLQGLVTDPSFQGTAK
ncbi:serine/threonine protein kinase with TPR repeats [Candidatus Koribacter versatilis Ellin345]|uniref:Serine/threonine protein kinase with TPR repeats n=1 Tax=Koribacter versatilis (strain Ellin345) TaxID=204669 RepID=Q1IU41_KORVE|nr:serine/threonine-protein kinase [Candidatus Koribacter versatilis]ABF39609.1 serine/threonine protein kinase with TPR repeats [Candidatus Koribacter versatilis Ellin345]